MCKGNSKNRRGFTIIELLIVLAILGVLSALLIPMLFNYVTEARQSKANENARKIYQAALQYQTAENENLQVLLSSVADTEYSSVDLTGFTKNETVTKGILSYGEYKNPTFVFIAVIRDHNIVGIVYADKKDDQTFGGYPKKVTEDYKNFADKADDFITANYSST